MEAALANGTLHGQTLEPRTVSDLVAWIKERLAEERLLQELRDKSLCDALALRAKELSEPKEPFEQMDGGSLATSTLDVARKQTCPAALAVTEKEVVRKRRRERAWRKRKALTTLEDKYVRRQAAEGGAEGGDTDLSKDFGEGSRASSHKISLNSSSQRALRSISGHKVSSQSESMLNRIVDSNRFDLTMAVIIFMQTIMMAVHCQHSGLVLGRVEGLPTGSPSAQVKEVWRGFNDLFDVVQLLFGAIFMLEMLMRFAAARLRYFTSAWNWLDFGLVSFWLGGFFVQFEVLNPSLLRIVRIVRLAKLLRLLKAFRVFDRLMHMSIAIGAGFGVTLWALLIMLLLFLAAAMLANSQLIEPMGDDSLEASARDELYYRFGTLSRSFITVAEISLGNWVPVCRLLFESVGEGVGFLTLLYRIVVDFSFVKVVAGIVMHETFSCADMDDSLMIIRKERTKRKFQQKMSKFLEAADSTGRGAITLEEFEEVLADAKMNLWLQSMDVNIKDPVGVFSYLVSHEHFAPETLSGQETLSLKELTSGIARLKGPAQSCDMLGVIADIKHMKNRLEAQVEAETVRLEQDLHRLGDMFLEEIRREHLLMRSCKYHSPSGSRQAQPQEAEPKQADGTASESDSMQTVLERDFLLEWTYQSKENLID